MNKDGFNENKRRSRYSLDADEDRTWPMVLVAIVAALMLHGLLFYYGPHMLGGNLVELAPDDPDHVRIIYSEQKERDYQDDSEETLETPERLLADEPIELPELDEAEMDLLDLPIQELDIAPGDTELFVSAAMEDSSSSMFEELALQTSVMPLPADVPFSVEAVPDPPAINASDVIASALEPVVDIDEASRAVDAEINKLTAEVEGMPGDTRSLAQLMKMENLGAGSGVARLGGDVLFEFGKCELRNAARVTMLQIAALILKNPETNFIIEGHTDSVGSDDYNDLLSLQRAASVRSWLKTNHIPTKNVYIRACGSRAPMVSASLPRDEQMLNRRVEIHMRKKQGEKMPQGALADSVEVDIKTATSALISRGVRANALKPAVKNTNRKR